MLITCCLLTTLNKVVAWGVSIFGVKAWLRHGWHIADKADYLAETSVYDWVTVRFISNLWLKSKQALGRFGRLLNMLIKNLIGCVFNALLYR
ncbi:hypothetical protein CXF82_17675 [Shewanella sp. GutDb-MelDb]|nr:hypothetical protein CXF82_17675 [Shewanella sp. GutDb-MelDb]PKG75452.1 hypothetical protein CXF86_07265 [Shewanella sp. GutCb]